MDFNYIVKMVIGDRMQLYGSMDFSDWLRMVLGDRMQNGATSAKWIFMICFEWLLERE